MAIISKGEVEELAKAKHDFCVSIFIPTDRSKNETLRWKGFLPLKSQLDELKNTLEKKGWSLKEIDAFVQPIETLIRDDIFWRHLSDGLAIFLAKDFFRKYTIPVHFEEYTYMSTEFYVKPLMPLFVENERFLLLSLTMSEVKLYEQTNHTITEIIIDDLIPAQLEDAVGYDFEQKSLQARSQKGSAGEGIFHSHVDNDVDKKDELARFFRGINKGLLSIYHDDQKPPLVLACVDYYYPIYKEVNTYQNLYPQFISGDPSRVDPLLLHEKAVNLLAPHLDKTRNEKRKLFLQNIGTGKASYDPREILPAALAGKVDTLFIRNGGDTYGVYDPENAEVEILDRSDENVSLTNMAAVNVFLNNGKVYLVGNEDMPNGISKMMALYRY